VNLIALRCFGPIGLWTSIGFHRLFDLMDESLRFEPEDHYPPYNIVRVSAIASTPSVRGQRP
jgi:hypothetical protein